RVSIAADAEDITVALVFRHLRGHALRDVDRLQLPGDRHGGKIDSRMDGADDEIGIRTLHEGAELARAGRRIGFGILGDELDRSSRNARGLIEIFDCGLGGFVVPVAPRRDAAGEVALMTDPDRLAGRLGHDIAHDREVEALAQDTSGEDALEEAAPCRHVTRSSCTDVSARPPGNGAPLPGWP